ncbi:helix-turn-helix domain-containing protein [Paracoccus sp. (in: a-proteobacteria)]|uniref:helix-turn-helix domain-containing protein n=1 Tax=Paracoccus sp. TaxID=267 RepID=UPI002AFE83FB|nr:helix-turn-helix domain-containing protein [Paracoccus sp. (in: a-proteobacteria)]
MDASSQIPIFNLFGETSAFPDVVHCERIWDRARLHDWEIAPHRHREMVQVFLMRRGQAQVRLDGQDSRLEDGQFLFIPARSVHGFKFRKGSEGLVLSIPLAVAAAISAGSDKLALCLSRPFSSPTDARVTWLGEQIYAGFGDTGAFRATLLVSLTQGVLAAIAGIAAQQGDAEASLAQRRMLALDRLIARRLGERRGMADYASALSITPGHLNRICRAATGESASRHIEKAVMTEASRLLAFTRLSVAEIGYRLGFSDPSYFSRRFRAVTGQSPTAYRDRFAG